MVRILSYRLGYVGMEYKMWYKTVMLSLVTTICCGQTCPPPTFLCTPPAYSPPVYVPTPPPPVCYYQWYNDGHGNLVSLYMCQ